MSICGKISERGKSAYGILATPGVLVYIQLKQALKKRHTRWYGVFSDLT